MTDTPRPKIKGWQWLTVVADVPPSIRWRMRLGMFLVGLGFRIATFSWRVEVTGKPGAGDPSYLHNELPTL